MPVYGISFVSGVACESSTHTFHAISPLTGERLDPVFHECSSEEMDRACLLAEEAAPALRALPADARASFLEKVAGETLALGDELLERANRETGLPLDRLTGERGRTVGQLRLFAEVVREGSWCDARIDPALPERLPIPRPDLRRMLVPLGPVVVFGSSNFPLAFSVAGGDTASAFAAGNPVIVKAHPAHPGTGELVAGAIARAVQACGLPGGTFSFLHGSVETAHALVRHPLVRAVGFTGSQRAGRALFDSAAARPEPIPVFAEMSSLNPLFILPGALRERGAQIAEGLKNSVLLGVGQFCTKPGLVFGLGGPEMQAFAVGLAELIEASLPATMLHAGIRDAFQQAVDGVARVPGVVSLATSEADPDPSRTQGGAAAFATDAETFLARRELHHELFGPGALLVDAPDLAGLVKIARQLEGQLTATIHGTAEDLAEAGELLAVLERKAGRLIINGFPTGVEVAPAMNHGGPYPATTDARFTSVGTAAILRFARPVCYQNFPASALPPELQNENPRGLMRLVSNRLTREALVV
ncbi:MAG: 2,5-dioxopentanoate dehydrogenase [Chthoniobacter sp.]|jgi:NADP-dependent aldehyde dehydrogenase|nr:2,5-dioxopentanoate dehydrogenase [Chthoniobacter sp.]